MSDEKVTLSWISDDGEWVEICISAEAAERLAHGEAISDYGSIGEVRRLGNEDARASIRARLDQIDRRLEELDARRQENSTEGGADLD